ncbi:hypothetical protein C475_06795 [Halosimplex carlsbadense 2-9-1]|uniref:Uncharacterized protein n=1 Tax=Halosimplex carlsbadense 2-9-1 TaxID=797114 RepID=M0CYV8_9EURY|nr:hypothetical protein [Halosimplex carlsbadense]ELZ27607.1 hypothetical protein C475_06795 [Halosimplex carlsbadense 2-9-1]
MTVRIRGAADIGDATTVLLLASDAYDRSADACVTVLDRLGDRIDRAVPVTISLPAAEWLALWEREADTGPPLAACVDVDRPTRSAAGAGDAHDTVPVERVVDPTDMEALGRRISDVLQRADDAGERVGVAVHSLTGVLGHVDESTAFKFVYTLGEVARRVDGIVVFHLDPEAHDDETVETFRIVCDAVVDTDSGRSAAAGP